MIMLFLAYPILAVNPNMQSEYTALPGVEVWNGIPHHDFRRLWYASLIVALGTVFQEGWTLLQCARGNDLGGPNNPGTPAQTIQSNNRILVSFIRF